MRCVDQYSSEQEESERRAVDQLLLSDADYEYNLRDMHRRNHHDISGKPSQTLAPTLASDESRSSFFWKFSKIT